jgi:hypothetical protein
MTATPVLPQTPKHGVVTIVNADGTANKTVLTTTNAGKLVALNICSTDTVSRVISIWLTRSGTAYLLGSVTVPAAAGTDGTNATVNALSRSLMPGLPTDNDGQPYILLLASDKIEVSAVVAIASTKTATVSAQYAEF